MIQKNKQANAMGQKIKFLIKSYGKTQEEFAYEFGCDPKTIRNWIRNGVDSITTTKQLAAVFGMSWKELVE